MTDLDLTLTPAQWEHLDRHDWTLTDAPAGVVPRTVGIVRPERHLVGWSDYYGRHSNGASDPCPTGRAASCPVCVVIPAERVGTATVTPVPVTTYADKVDCIVADEETADLVTYPDSDGGYDDPYLIQSVTELFDAPPAPGTTVWRLDKENNR